MRSYKTHRPCRSALPKASREPKQWVAFAYLVEGGGTNRASTNRPVNWPPTTQLCGSSIYRAILVANIRFIKLQQTPPNRGLTLRVNALLQHPAPFVGAHCRRQAATWLKVAADLLSSDLAIKPLKEL